MPSRLASFGTQHVAADASLLWFARLNALAVALTVLLALLPVTIVPNAVPLAATAGGLLFALVARDPRAPFRYDLATPFSLFFAGVGLIYVAASAMELLPAGPLRPVNHDFIPRHAYYIVLWLPMMAGATELFRSIMPDLSRAARRFALPLFACLAAGDFLSALAFGGDEHLAEGYVAFLHPSVVTFVYATCFFLYVGVTRRIGWPLFIASLHYVLSNEFNYGIMFNTLTGTFVLVALWVFALAIRWSARLAFYGVLAVAAGMIAILVVAIIMPSILSYDANTQWRFLVWRENLLAALNTGLIGVGFGTPYFPLNTGNIADAFRLVTTPDFAVHENSSPIDILYVRGQHSSYVNAFYRMGVLGSGLLIAFNLAVIVMAWRAANGPPGERQALAVSCAAIFVVGVTTLALHVALETARYFCMYALAVGASRAASSYARSDA